MGLAFWFAIMTSVVHCIRPGKWGKSEIPIDQPIEENCNKGGQNTGGQIRSRPKKTSFGPPKGSF